MEDLATLGPALERWIPKQRWFQGKDRVVRRVRPVDEASVSPRVRLVVVEVAYEGFPPDRYLLPLSPFDGGPFELGGRRWGDALTGAGAGGPAEGVGDPEAVRQLAALACEGRRLPAASGGAVTGIPVTGRRPGPGVPVRRLAAEQSNTSAVLDDAWILKVLRRLEPGTHPDIELTAALTEQGFAHVPAQHGSIQLEAAGEPTALAVLSDFAAGAEEGWSRAVAETAGRAGGMLADLPALGAAVADLHLTLERAFGSEPVDPAVLDGWARSMRAQLDRVLVSAGERAAEATAGVRARADDIRRVFERITATGDGGRLVRIHGDLHLGQVLWDPGAATENAQGAGGRWLLLDFEGEPLRPLAERRAPGTPLRDVAGMLRSFDYAAAEPHDGQIPPAAAAWRDEARERLLNAYRERAAPLLPADIEPLLTAWELDKAVYELGYELANRPAWVPIPVAGILGLTASSRPGAAS